jgi:hypothetical protein
VFVSDRAINVVLFLARYMYLGYVYRFLYVMFEF